MKRSIKKPTPEVHKAIESLISAVDAHVSGDQNAAAALFRQANCLSTWQWLNDAWIVPRRNVVFVNPEGDSRLVPKAERDADRDIEKSIRKAVLERDGHRCRYCGLPVVSAEIRKIAHNLYPQEVSWTSNPAEQHSAFQVTWLQYDHVIPHSHGGRSSPENVVISCALCNFGKDGFTLRQLDLEDPRLRPPLPSDFDGLEVLRSFAPVSPPRSRGRTTNVSPVRQRVASKEKVSNQMRFFFPGAWISAGYVYTPHISGKERWFKLGGAVEAEVVELNGASGCVVSCPLDMLIRRGIDAERYRLRFDGRN